MRSRYNSLRRTFQDASPRVFLAEDEWYTANGIRNLFGRAGYLVFSTENGSDAVRLLMADAEFDVALLDVTMPGMDGFEVLTRVRGAGVMTPIIMLTGRATETDRVRGLGLGADDYLAKPFSGQELLARAKAVRRRGRGASLLPKKIRVGDVIADFESFAARRADESIHFTPLEWAVLRHMAHRKGKAVSREEFNVEVLKIPADIETRTIDRHAYALRRKIEGNRQKPRHVLSVTAVGYRLADFEVLEY